MSSLSAHLKQIKEARKHIEDEVRQLRLKGQEGQFEIQVPPTTITVRVRPHRV